MNLKKWFSSEETDIMNDSVNDQFYDIKAEDAIAEDGSTKMVLLEPRAYSEAQQIADQLKTRNTVVVNLKRVTSDQAKRIIDFLTGVIFALDGSIQKIGPNIILCAPQSIGVGGSINLDSDAE